MRKHISAISRLLSQDQRVVFAYLYGSALSCETPQDIDIAVYAIEGAGRHELSADLKIALARETGFAPELFDIRVINGIIEHGDLFALLYVKDVLQENHLLTDSNPDIRTDFLEQYSLKYRECEGLFQEVLG